MSVEITDNDIINYIKNTRNMYPHCKMDEYLAIKKDITEYINPKSQMQIKSIVKNQNTKKGLFAYYKLSSLFAKFIRSGDYSDIINKILKSDTDYDAYIALRNYLNVNIKSIHRKAKRNNKIVCSRSENHAESMYYHFKHINYKPDNYLDIGCGDCMITKHLGKLLNIPNNKIYGADIKSWSSYSVDNRDVNINFIEIKENSVLPIKTNEFSLISAFMMLHHVRNLPLLLSEINRCLKKDGYLLIREHDAFTNTDKMICDIEHGIYDVSYQKDLNFFDNFYARYFDWIEWDIILKRFGFERCAFGYEYINIYQEIGASRPMYMIYKK